MKKISIKRVAFVAIFSAIAGLLYCYVKFNLPIFPPFLDINISMIPVIICAFMLGPWDAGIVVLIRFIMKILLVSTGTAYVGEIADILLGLLVCLPTGFMYRYMKNEKKELITFLSSIAIWIVSSILINVFINIPFYVQNFFGGSIEPLVGMCRDSFKLISFGLINNVTASNFMFYYIILAVIPFNALLSIVVILVTALVHKRLKNLYDEFNF